MSENSEEKPEHETFGSSKNIETLFLSKLFEYIDPINFNYVRCIVISRRIYVIYE